MKRPYSVAMSLALVASTFAIVSAVGTTTASAGSVKPADECIVSLSPTATETLYKIGAGPQVEAVDTDSDYPTTGLPSTRINPFAPNAEQIATICTVTKAHPTRAPSLVVVYYNADHIVQKLRSLHITVAYQQAPTVLAGAYGQMIQLGELTGHATAATALVASIKAAVTKDIQSVPAHAKQILSTYWEISPPPYIYSATSVTFIGQLLSLLGTKNIANGVSQPHDEGYPALTDEYVISKDPKLVFLADSSSTVTAATFDARPGYEYIPAVEFNHVVPLNDDIASRWGPRIVNLMASLTVSVKAALADKAMWKK
jgi:iron complex transport system substrate-binding protein